MIIDWFLNCAKTEEFNGKRILEVGSLDINGSIRPTIEGMKPKEYIGIDLSEGKGVDLVLQAEKIVEHFGAKSFDAVISTETLEHVLDWRLIINNMKEVLRPKGFIYISIPEFAYPHHAHPYDNWRYTSNDVARIFDDFEIWNLTYSICFKGRKPQNHIPKDLSDLSLYSMKLRKRTKEILLNDKAMEVAVDKRKSGEWEF